MAAKILVVDDEPQFERLILQRFRRKVREGIYEFVFAQNGVEALEVMARETGIDMVLTDINMPQMDGLTLLGELKERYPLLKTVIVSAYGDMKNIRTAMNSGAFDFVTKPIEFADLETTIEKTLQESEMLKEVERARSLAEENERLEAVDALKSQFFTNISHEFRTPLTVISGMAEQIGTDPERWMAKGLLMIRRNTHSLLDLVNQILDLRKLESGKLQLHLEHGDVISYLHYIFESFVPLAETRDIQLHFLNSVARVEMDYDAEKMLRIVSNLLDNAIKFTPEGGQIYLIVDRVVDTFFIRVRDTGVGIAEEQQAAIFDRFYQAQARNEKFSQGTGIGLSLVKQLVQLLEGSIDVESKINEGTTITIQLPIHANAEPVSMADGSKAKPMAAMKLSSLEATASAGTTPIPIPEAVAELPTLLIIEDNLDVSAYLQACLEGIYELSVADNGEDGINKAIEEVPDIIISDVMMPKKDGYEVCATLKQDQRTSHIPIVLLTAKADAESRIKGLGFGADAYLAKPFERRELLIRLEKLLELRAKLQERYRSAELPNAEEEAPEHEDLFVQEMREAILDNIDDENFGILEMCQLLAMSRTQLHRKVKALTGRSTSLFIRSVRLLKAKELLNSNTELNISQIAYEVGFKDPKYFSRTFSDEFGVSPNQIRKEE